MPERSAYPYHLELSLQRQCRSFPSQPQKAIIPPGIRMANCSPLLTKIYSKYWATVNHKDSLYLRFEVPGKPLNCNGASYRFGLWNRPRAERLFFLHRVGITDDYIKPNMYVKLDINEIDAKRDDPDPGQTNPIHRKVGQKRRRSTSYDPY